MKNANIFDLRVYQDKDILGFKMGNFTTGIEGFLYFLEQYGNLFDKVYFNDILLVEDLNRFWEWVEDLKIMRNEK